MELTGLRKTRETALLTQAELAALAGVHQITVSHLERSSHRARMKTICALARAPGVAPTALTMPSGDGGNNVLTGTPAHDRLKALRRKERHDENQNTTKAKTRFGDSTPSRDLHPGIQRRAGAGV